MPRINSASYATVTGPTASDDFLLIDGTTNGTRKISAATPAFLTSATVPTVKSPAGSNLVLALGTGGTALTLADTTLVATFASTIKSASTANGEFNAALFSNTGGGTAAEVSLYLSNAGTGATSTFLNTQGTAYTTVGGYFQDGGAIGTGTGLSGGLSIMARAASSDVRIYAGSHTNLVATFASTGVFSVPATTASTSSTTGSVLTAGGFATSNTTDASSSTNGGSGTFAGGLAVAKSAYVGGVLYANAGAQTALIVGNTGQAGSFLNFQNSGDVSAYIGTATAGDLLVQTNAVTRITVAKTTGLVTIAQNLTVSGSTSAIGAAVSATTNLNLSAGTTGISSLRVPHGSAPTSPVDGDIWTTTSGLYVRINGVTVGPLS